VAADRLEDQRPDEVVLLLDSAEGNDAALAVARQYRLTLMQGQSNELMQARVQRYRITDGRTPADVLSAMQGDKRILLSQPNHLYRLQSGEGGGGKLDGQYAADKIRLGAAHSLAKGRRTLIAVIDSGVDLRHPELAGAVARSFDAVGDGTVQPDAHGTAVAAIIGARSRLLGVAPAGRLLAVRAFKREGRDERITTTFILLRAIDWAYRNQARILNLSFTGPRDAAVELLLTAAHGKGVVLTAAAGNGGAEASAAYPAAYPQVIAVTALDRSDRLYSEANQGDYIALAAPGVDLLVAVPNGGYGFKSGTSFAAAHVSGMIALMLERNPTLTPDQVHSLLTASTTDLGPRGRDAMFGAGGVDALRSVEAAVAARDPESK
jgi:subtilisin family serine protease